MSLPTWPEGLPYNPRRAGYAVLGLVRLPITTPMEDGPARMRQATTADWTRLAYRIPFTNAQFETFRGFVQTIGRGASRFTMRVGRPATPAPWPLKTCYIERGEWSMQLEGLRNVVSFTLVVLDY